MVQWRLSDSHDFSTIRINEDRVNSFALTESVCVLSDGDFSLMNIISYMRQSNFILLFFFCIFSELWSIDLGFCFVNHVLLILNIDVRFYAGEGGAQCNQRRASSYEPSWPGWLGYRDEIGARSVHMVTFSPLSEMKNLKKWWRYHSGVKSNEQAWRKFLDFLCFNNLKFLLTLRKLSNKTIPNFIVEEQRNKSPVMSFLSRKCIVLFSSR